MGWSIGFDTTWNRDIGYGVPATCDHPGCKKKIDRGLGYVCGGEAYGGEHGCGLFFCGKHTWVKAEDDGCSPQVCERCRDGKDAFEAKPDIPVWMRWKLKDESWEEWRKNNPKEVAEIRAALELVTWLRYPKNKPLDAARVECREGRRVLGVLEYDAGLDAFYDNEGAAFPVVVTSFRPAPSGAPEGRGG